jgi:hypothetical protein
MPAEILKSFREVARDLGIDRATVADVVSILEIETKPITTNAKARGLDPASVRRIKAHLWPQRARGKR